MQHLVIILTLLTFTHFTYANTPSEQPKGPLPDGLHSKILNEQRQLVIQLPKSYHQQPKLRYPVLYLLDGPRNIAHTAGTLDLLSQSDFAPEHIIIGIHNTDRQRDFTPTANVDPRLTLGEGGGGDKFLNFIEFELIPYIDKHYRTRPFKIISGHSIGGLLAIHSLQSRPHLFNAHFAFSPAVWWSDRITIKNTQAFLSKTKRLSNYLYMNIGSEGGEMHEVYEGLNRFLQNINIEQFVFKSDVFANEPHNITAAAGQFNAYRGLYLPLSMSIDQTNASIGAIEQYYQKVSQQYGRQVAPPEAIINSAGYFQLMNQKDPKASIPLFAYNVKHHPDSAAAYDGLADGYEGDGQLQKAIAQMALAIKHSSPNDNGHAYFEVHHQRLLGLVKGKP